MPSSGAARVGWCTLPQAAAGGLSAAVQSFHVMAHLFPFISLVSRRFADAQVSLKAAQETARNKTGQIKEMEASVEKHRWASCTHWL